MKQPLPQSEFKWVPEHDLQKLGEIIATYDINMTGDEIQEVHIGYILEVDLHYPSVLHDSHSDYPLCPERMKISREMLSPYCKNILADLNRKPCRVEKLVNHLGDRKNYIIHYRTL